MEFGYKFAVIPAFTAIFAISVQAGRLFFGIYRKWTWKSEFFILARFFVGTEKSS
jgi:hypothetical protein